MIKPAPLLGAIASLLVFAIPRPAAAELIITDDGAVPQYTVEIEPHGVLTPFWPPRGSADVGLGAGALIGINLAERGFIPDVADSVALGLGFDWVKYFGGRGFASECAEYSGTGNEAVCVRTVGGGGGSGAYLFVPAVMQWNFYLTDAWSVFAEPGLSTYFSTGGVTNRLHVGLTPVFNLGGRFHFSERMTLTMRVGYPYTTVGLSLYL